MAPPAPKYYVDVCRLGDQDPEEASLDGDRERIYLKSRNVEDAIVETVRLNECYQDIMDQTLDIYAVRSGEAVAVMIDLER